MTVRNNMKTRYCLIALLLFIITRANVLYANTNVSGVISSDVTWKKINSPYIVTGNILVDSAVTLTIQPGVIVKFNNGLSIFVKGELIARGTASDSIVFTSNTLNSAGAWGYIYFSSTSVPAKYLGNFFGNYVSGSILEYCVIQYAGGANVANNGALRFDNATPFVNHCKVSHNSATGINAYNLIDSLKITNSLISYNSSSNQGGGMFIDGSNKSYTLISGNNIIYNYSPTDGGGIWVNYNYPWILITNNIFAYNTALDDGAGINANPYHGSVEYNIVMNNTAMVDGGGIETDNVYVFNNYIINNVAHRDGGGATVYSTATYNNVIADNDVTSINAGYGRGGGIEEGYESINHNQIVRNSAMNDAAIYHWLNPGNMLSNTIAFNRNSDTSIATNRTIFVGDVNNTINNNNIFGNKAFYDLYNGTAQGSLDIDAKSNWWGTNDNTAIQGKIYDWTDDNTLGIVNYSPYLSKPDTAAPVSIPFNVTKTDMGGGNVKIKWNQNPESDIAGYHIYYGNFTGYSFSNMIDVVGKADTSYTLSGIPIGDTIAVTAYDMVFSPANEIDSTITNDNMTNGNESWFTYAVAKPSPAFSATTVSVCPGDTVYYTANTGSVYPYANTSWEWSFPGGKPSVSTSLNPKVVYNTPGKYNAKLKVTNIAGSDSLTNVNYVTVKIPTYATITEHLCNVGFVNSPSRKYIWFSNGTYYDTIPNYAGCDSMLTIHLTLNINSYNTIYPESCKSFKSPSGNHIWPSSGLYYDTIPNAAGCDSIITVSLTIDKIDTSITSNGKMLSVNISGASYQWLDCGNNYSIIPGETNQSFTPSVNGAYAVQITQNTCIDTSRCYHVIVTDANILSMDNNLEIFPNPASDYFMLKYDNPGNEKVQLNIYNILGKIVKSEMLNQKLQGINISDLSNGIYMLAIRSKNITINKRLIIQK
jgi:Secretion system C-terminal sorting domain/PKD domain